MNVPKTLALSPQLYAEFAGDTSNGQSSRVYLLTRPKPSTASGIQVVSFTNTYLVFSPDRQSIMDNERAITTLDYLN